MFKLIHNKRHEQLSRNYKVYRSILNRTTTSAKQHYYKQTVSENRSHPEKMWKTIYELSHIKKRARVVPTKIKTESKDEQKDKRAIANSLNDFFVSIGSKMAKTISNTKSISNFKTTLSTNRSIFLFPSTPQEVGLLIDKLKIKKSNRSIRSLRLTRPCP